VRVDRVDEYDSAQRSPGLRPADAPAKMPADAPAGEKVRPVGTAREAELDRRAIERRLHRVLVDHVYGVARDA
jgi:hypothetical protein